MALFPLRKRHCTGGVAPSVARHLAPGKIKEMVGSFSSDDRPLSV